MCAMSFVDDFDGGALVWETAAAVPDEHQWMTASVVSRVLSSAGDAGVSLAAWCAETATWKFGYDPFAAYAWLGALQDAAETTGLTLPWEQHLVEGDLVLVPTDRDAALRLLAPLHDLPPLNLEIVMLTAV